MPIDTLTVKSYVKQNLPGIHRVCDLAKDMGLNSETLRKDFVRKEGTALSDYILSERVQLARNLLETTEMKCFEILFKVGFSREDSGAKTFKRMTGMTMEEYRVRFRPQ